MGGNRKQAQPVTVQRGGVPVAQQPKTSSYLNQKQATNKTAKFWGDLTKMAEKAGKIETIDCRVNPLSPTDQGVGLNTRIRTPQNQKTHIRGQGGIQKDMNGDRKREVSGSQHHEHNAEGRLMNAILQPDSAPQTRRATTPKVNNFIRSSTAIGSTICVAW